MFDITAYLYGLGAILAAGILTWVISVWRRDVSIVDSLWSLMFLAAALVYWQSDAAGGERSSVDLVFRSYRTKLQIKNWWWEPDITPTEEMKSELRTCFIRFLKYLGLEKIQVDKRITKQESLAWLSSLII